MANSGMQGNQEPSFDESAFARKRFGVAVVLYFMVYNSRKGMAGQSPGRSLQVPPVFSARRKAHFARSRRGYTPIHQRKRLCSVPYALLAALLRKKPATQ